MGESMGLYIRKALRVGPVRFNLSTSGIGVSSGVRGFRVGTGPRGNYVHVGRGGVYFRQTLRPSGPVGYDDARPALISPPVGDAVGPFEEIESSAVLSLVDGEGSDLLRELNEKRKKFGLFWPTVIVTLIAFVLLPQLDPPPWAVGLGAIVVVVLWWLARTADSLRRTTVAFYHLEDEIQPQFEALLKATAELKSSTKVWHIGANAAVKDRKYHAGASTLVRRRPTSPNTGQPPRMKLNIDVPMLPVGRQTLAFMPDRVLVFDPGGVGEVGYRELEVTRKETPFADDDGAPADATVVRTTWQYVNKQGGPDRRFKANRQLPVCLYEEILFRSPTGLNEMIQASRLGAGQAMVEALDAMKRAVPGALATPRRGA